MLPHRDLLQFLITTLLISACSGGGCGGCEGSAIPGGFPSESRVASAIQLRVTSSALDAIEADPSAIVAGVLGQEQLSFPVPASCGSDPEVCCAGGTPSATCGPLLIDLEEQPGDLPRLVISPAQANQRVDVIVRARLNSAASIPVRYLGISCDIDIDTSAGARDGIELTMAIHLPQDPDELTTRMEVRDSAVDLEEADITIGGNFLCGGVNAFLKGFILNLLTDQITSTLSSSLSDSSCAACPSGTTAECGSFATACESEVCMIGDRCEQQLGLASRMTVASIFGGLSQGQLGSMDLYDLLGGYAETDAQGVSMGMYSGALPFAQARDRCGPPALPPTHSTVAQSSFFAGNTRPDTGAPFGIGIGVHQQVLDNLAFALYESGALCLNIGASSVDLLTTDGLAPLLMPSVLELLHGTNSSIVIGLRPQSPPSILIGAGTTSVDGSGETVIDEPLLDIKLDGTEIDFFVMVDDQFIRVMTLTANIHLPMNLEANAMGEIEPVIGDVDNAFSEVSVSNSEALRESDADLEARIPVLLNLALGPLVGSLGSFALPELGGLKLSIAQDGILSIEDNAFLAIFADISVPTTMARVQTSASLETLWTDGKPGVRLHLGGDLGALEFSYRVDGGPWAPYTRANDVLLTREIFSVPGDHRIEVRARQIGRGLSLDASPVHLIANFGKPGATYFHGSAKEAGCTCDAGGNHSGSSGSAWLIALVAGCFLIRRRRRPSGRLISLVLLGSLSVGAQACDCSGAASPCPDGCLEGQVERGPTGRYSSLASDAERVVAAAYDDKLGDLVLIERDAEGGLSYRAIAGLPIADPTYEPSTYRGGIAAPGPDQGIWTSVALHEGLVRVAFVDADDGTLHLASELPDKSYVTEQIDADTGLGGATYVSLSISSSGQASVAYLASGLPGNGTSGFVSELRVASQSTNWQHQVVDVGPVSCGGYCAQGEACIAGETISECVAPSGECAGACSETESCIASTCVARIDAPTIYDLPEGVGLFAKLRHRSDDSLVLAYYDRILTSLRITTSTGTGFAPVASLENARLDIGMWLTMAIDRTDAAHLAFQDASGDRLMYARFADGVLSAPEVVDDGTREGEVRSHPVGASAAILVNGDLIPSIVYQDALSSDVDLARRELDSWSRSTLMEGARLDGFFLQASAQDEQTWVSHYFYDRAQIPAGELEIVALP